MTRFGEFIFCLGVIFGVLRICCVESPPKDAVSSSFPKPNGDGFSHNVDQKIIADPPSPLLPTDPTIFSTETTQSPDAASSESTSAISSVVSTSELDQLVLPTIAPATPRFDVEASASSISVNTVNGLSQEVLSRNIIKELPDKLSDQKLGVVESKMENKEGIKEDEEGKKTDVSAFLDQKKASVVQQSDIESPVAPPEAGSKAEGKEDAKGNDSNVVIVLKGDKENKDDLVGLDEGAKKDQQEKLPIIEEKSKNFFDKDEKQQQEIGKDKKDTEKPEEEGKKKEDKEPQENREEVSKALKEEDKKKTLDMMQTPDEDSITAKLKQAEEETKSSSEDMPSFDEFKRQLQQEEEKQKSKLKKQKEEQTVPAGQQTKQKPKKIKERKQNNYASVDCGAKILSTNPEATNTYSILQDNRDIYMLNPCSTKIWFIVELCDTAQVRRIDIANFELFSSTPESFRVFVSGRYPTREWALLGTFQARDERTLQSFPLDEPIYAKYFKVEMLSHFGKEHYCPISLFRVFGTSMMEELEDHEAGGQDESESSDQDDDAIPVLPHDPSVKSQDASNEPNILATVGDTLMNMVKKLTGVIKDAKQNDTNDKIPHSTVAPSSSIVSSMVSQQSKPSIVTFIPSEEEDEQKSNKTTKNLSKTDNKSDIAHKKDSAFKNVDIADEKETSTASITRCKMVVRMLGHSGFGCLISGILYSKRSKQHGLTPKSIKSSHKDKKISKASGDTVEKNREMSKESKQSERKIEKPDEIKKQEKPEKIEKLSSKDIDKGLNTDKEITGGILTDTPSKDEIMSTPSVNNTSIDPSVMIKPSQPSIEKSLGAETKRTPSLVTVSKSDSQVSETSNSEAKITDSKSTQENPTASEETTTVVESSISKSKEENMSSSSDVSKKSSADDSPVKPTVESKGSCTSLPADNNSQGTSLQPTTPSKCVAPTVTSNLKDVDVLEFEILDGTGREGTAHPEKPVYKPEEPDKQEKPAKQEKLDKQEKPDEIKETEEKIAKDDKKDAQLVSNSTISLDKQDTSRSISIEISKSHPDAIPSTLVNEKPTEPPTTPPPVKGVLEDSVQPLPQPPVVVDNTVDLPHTIEVSLVDETAKPSSSAVNQGLPSSGAQKESIFMRLTNRIKALEQNLTLSTLYMEKLNQKYRRIIEDMQKNFDKKINLLTNATIKAENVIKSQKEQITQLQDKVGKTEKEMERFTKKLSILSKDVMERHIIGLFLEIFLIIMLFIVFRRWDRARLRRDLLRDSYRNGTVPGSHGFNTFPEERKTMLMNGTLSAREQLQRSFSTPVLPENIGAVNRDNKTKDESHASFDVKKKRHRKRPKSAFLGNEPLTASESAPDLTNQSSVVNTTAGLLFSPTRGLLSGLPDSWLLPRSNSWDDSHLRRKSVSGSTSYVRLHKAKSLDVIEENAPKKGRIPTPPPPPPPKRLPGQLPSHFVNRKGRGLHGN